MRLKVTSDDLNDSDVSCGAKKTVGGVDIVVETGSGPCLEGNVLKKILKSCLLMLERLLISFTMTPAGSEEGSMLRPIIFIKKV